MSQYSLIMMTTMLLKVLLSTMAYAAGVGAIDLKPSQPLLHTWQRSVAGAGAFATATILTSPIDVVKTRTQASLGARNSFEVALEMLRQEGVLCFFSGLAPALMMAPAAMVQYTVIDPLRARFPLYLAAMIAGALSVTIKCPFDRLKTLMQNDPGRRTASALFLATLRDAGVGGLWTGYAATLVRDMPYHLLKWGVYVQAQALLLRGPAAALSQSSRNLLAGAAAGALGCAIVTPADLIKTRLQVARGDANGFVGIAREILAEEGASGLFRGLGLRLARIPFYTAITLATFDGIKDAFLRA